MKNYSDTIKDKSKRQLTAKANKFVWQVIELVAKSKGLNKFEPAFKGEKERLLFLLHDVLIDKEMTIQEVKALIWKNFNLKLQSTIN